MTAKIINDPTPLSPDYLPEKILFRNDACDKLMQNVENRVNSLVFGPIGSGKTTLIKRVMTDMSKQVETRYTDCLIYPTEYSVLSEILPGSRLIPLRSNYELTKELKRLTKEKRVTLFLDNFVRLKDPSLVRRVMMLGVNCVIIGRIDRNAAALTENMLSNFPASIKLDQYTEEESFDILKDRAQRALIEDAYTDDTLQTIAAKIKGNITLGINLLRAISISAQSEHKRRIEDTNWEEFLPDDSDMLDLKPSEKTLLKILKNEKTLPSGKLFAIYRQATQLAKCERSFRNYMQRLCLLNLVRAIGQNSSRSYQIIS